MINDVLVVCHGNYIRSPMAEQVFRAHLPDVRFSSAGFAPQSFGGPMAPVAARELEAAGYPSDHVCRGFTNRALAADVLLVMDTGMRVRLVHLGVPAQRIWTLPELDPRSLDGDEVANPYFMEPRVYRAVLGLIERCVPELTRRLRL